MSVQYEVMASTGSYTDKNGQEKKRWVKCGVVMATKSGGLALKMETMPVGGDGWFSLAPKPKLLLAVKALRVITHLCLPQTTRS